MGPPQGGKSGGGKGKGGGGKGSGKTDKGNGKGGGKGKGGAKADLNLSDKIEQAQKACDIAHADKVAPEKTVCRGQKCKGTEAGEPCIAWTKALFKNPSLRCTTCGTSFLTTGQQVTVAFIKELVHGTSDSEHPGHGKYVQLTRELAKARPKEAAKAPWSRASSLGASSRAQSAAASSVPSSAGRLQAKEAKLLFDMVQEKLGAMGDNPEDADPETLRNLAASLGNFVEVEESCNGDDNPTLADKQRHTKSLLYKLETLDKSLGEVQKRHDQAVDELKWALGAKAELGKLRAETIAQVKVARAAEQAQMSKAYGEEESEVNVENEQINKEEFARECVAKFLVCNPELLHAYQSKQAGVEGAAAAAPGVTGPGIISSADARAAARSALRKTPLFGAANSNQASGRASAASSESMVPSLIASQRSSARGSNLSRASGDSKPAQKRNLKKREPKPKQAKSDGSAGSSGKGEGSSESGSTSDDVTGMSLIIPADDPRRVLTPKEARAGNMTLADLEVESKTSKLLTVIGKVPGMSYEIFTDKLKAMLADTPLELANPLEQYRIINSNRVTISSEDSKTLSIEASQAIGVQLGLG